MTSKARGDAGEYEFTRAAYDELKDSEKHYNVHYTVSTRPSDSRGVWVFRVIASICEDGCAAHMVANYEASWPNSMVVSYGAFLYQMCHRTARMVEMWHKQRKEAEQASE